MKMRLFAICLSLAAPGFAWAATVQYHATLLGSSEVPPTGSTATGNVAATLDTGTKVLDYTVSWTGLTGPATMAHFHGPAPTGKNAGVEVVVGSAGPVSPVRGKATLTAAQVAQLNGGLLYVNVHSAKFPKGEIRGQVEK